MLIAVYVVIVLKHLFLKGINPILWLVVSSSVLSADIILVLKNRYFFSSEFFPNL
jgi:hypothetical protein